METVLNAVTGAIDTAPALVALGAAGAAAIVVTLAIFGYRKLSSMFGR